MDDLISRQAAIDAVNDVIADYIPNIYGRYETLPLELASAVNRLPSAQLTAEPVRHGKWIYGNEFHWYTASCSRCGYKRTTDIKAANWNGWKYCPMCGARMDDAKEEIL